MKSHPTPSLLARRLPLLLCAGLFAFTLSASADGHGHGHHFNPHFNGHFNGHPPGHAYGWNKGNYNNFKQYNPQHGYYPGYFNNYPAYSPNYRGQNYYNNSNYGQTNHRTLLNQLLNRL